MRKGTTILSALIAIGLLLTMTATSFAMPIDFSGSTSDETDPAPLKAVVDFSFELLDELDPATGTLTIKVTNNTKDPKAYTISQLYFNVSDNVDDLWLTDSPFGIGKKMSEYEFDRDSFQVDGYGRFDVCLDFGQGNTGVESGMDAEFKFFVFGNNFDEALTAEDFIQLSAPNADKGNQVAVLKFAEGPGDDSAFAAPGTVVPEPATILLLGSGLVGLAGLGRKKEFFKE